jgi:hypothetical protein
MMLLILGRTASTIFGTAAFIAACGGDSSGPNTTDLHVAGTYDTAVTLQQNTCGAITVQRFVTTVAHTAGATTLTLTHNGISYAGTVQRNGTFATTPKPISAGAETHTLTIAGTFTTTAIDATVTADVARAGSTSCQYSVKWAGAKQGAPNVIPGS